MEALEVIGNFACEAWDIGSPTSVIDFAGSVDRSVRISTTSGDYFLRIWNPARHTDRAVRARVAAVRHLAWPRVELVVSKNAEEVVQGPQNRPTTLTRAGGGTWAPIGPVLTPGSDPISSLSTRVHFKSVPVVDLPEWRLEYFDTVYSASRHLLPREYKLLEEALDTLWAGAVTPIVAHGDLSPGNLLRDAFGIRVCDFGHVGLAPLGLEIGNWCAAWLIRFFPGAESGNVGQVARAKTQELAAAFGLPADEVLAGAAVRIARGIAMMRNYSHVTNSGESYLKRLRRMLPAIAE
ncbi:phosphotransferase [Nostocoides vanveenii]|uniref:phosphotransferase n=1 Tax=Nostocoides vanveenii TaxID=330835 RepID=UPI003CD09433